MTCDENFTGTLGLRLPLALTTCERNCLDQIWLPKPHSAQLLLMHESLPARSNAPSQSTNLTMSDLDCSAQNSSSLSRPTLPSQLSISSSPSSSSPASSASSDDGLTTESNN